MEKIIKIDGMHCEGCVSRIENVLKEIDGIKNFKVNLAEKNMKLEIEDEQVLKQVKEKIEDLGFEVVE